MPSFLGAEFAPPPPLPPEFGYSVPSMRLQVAQDAIFSVQGRVRGSSGTRVDNYLFQ